MTVSRVPNVEGGIQPTIVTAKGDLITAVANANPARLGVGSDGQLLIADSTTATGIKWDNNLNDPKINLAFDAQTGTTYTTVLNDNSQIITMNNASANTLFIPTNASVAYPIGTQINVLQIGVGQTTIQAVTSGTTTILSTGATSAAPKLRTRYSMATCIKSATDTWYVVGDIA